MAQEVSHCNLVELARQRNIRDEENPAYFYCPDEAERIVNTIARFRHSKGEWAGQRFELSDWQAFDIIRPLFGWLRHSDGTRRFRLAYIEVPRKNGKSTLAAAVGNVLFLADDEPGAEVYTAATKRDQARIVHSEAVRMVKSMQREEPNLHGYIQIFKMLMTCEATNSRYEPLSSESSTLDGLNLSGCIIDELHAHRTRDMYDKLQTARGSRRQPLLFIITTAGFDRTSVCWELHNHAVRVLEGIIQDDSFFAYIATCDEGDDWTQPETWRKANPNLGVSVKMDNLSEECNRAKESVPLENAFRRFHLNQWTEQDVRWIPMERWDACCQTEEIDLEGRDCWCGLDLASTKDITAFVMAFPDGERVILRAYYWVPAEAADKRSRRDRLPYEHWVQEGVIRKTPGNMTDYGVVRRDINELADRYAIQEIAVDRYFQGAQLAGELKNQDAFNVVYFGQGYASMAAPTLAFDSLIHSGNLSHNGDPVLRWMASNVTVTPDPAGCLKPDKSKSTEKIDGIVGAIMAVGVMNRSIGQTDYRSAKSLIHG